MSDEEIYDLAVVGQAAGLVDYICKEHVNVLPELEIAFNQVAHYMEDVYDFNTVTRYLGEADVMFRAVLPVGQPTDEFHCAIAAGTIESVTGLELFSYKRDTPLKDLEGWKGN